MDRFKCSLQPIPEYWKFRSLRRFFKLLYPDFINFNIRQLSSRIYSRTLRKNENNNSNDNNQLERTSSLPKKGTFFDTLKQIFFATQSAFTCSKLTIETLEQGVKYVQSSRVSIFNFEHVIAGWESKFISLVINFYVDKLFGDFYNQDNRASDAHRCIQNSLKHLGWSLLRK